ncbi:trichohyalin-like isoform X7 [Mytilus trossulus]|uniref:trichohyalin-like isoform X7 n=1 Tax=Mytilus trossulus TaxID=6551 RepID=UPI0030054B45
MDVASRASRASYRPKVQRVKSAELSDLHVYIVPPDLWRERYNNLLNQNVTETISAGIIRVHPETRVCNLRDELETQLGAELLPRDFIFLKSVGRSITRLKPKQEFQLKVKHFLPPNSYAPELYLLEVENRDDENETTGSTRPTTRSPQFTERVTDKPVASSHQPVASKYDPRSATYTNQTNDSGIAGLTPEEYRENFDDAERRKNEYNESRQKELENRLNGDRMNGDLDDSDRQRRLREDQEREEWERKNRDEDERRRREEEDRRRREEEERQREEDERRRREEEREKMAREKLSGSDERQLQGRMRKGARSTHLTPMDPDWTKRGVHGDYDQGTVYQVDQKLGPQGERDDQTRSYRQNDDQARSHRQTDRDERTYEQRDDQAGTYRQNDDQVRSHRQTDSEERTYEQRDDQKGTDRQSDDQAKSHRQTDKDTRAYHQTDDKSRQPNDQTRAYGHTNDQTREYGPNNDQTRDYGQTDDQKRAYSNRDQTSNEYDQRRLKGSVAVPSDKFVQVALRPDPNLNEPISDSELYSKEDSSNSPRNTNAPAINFPQNNNTYRQGNQKERHEGSNNPASHRQNEREYSDQRYEAKQNNERNNDGHEESHSYTTGKVSKTFVKDGVEYRHSDDTNRQYQPSGTDRSVQQTRSSTRSYPRQETEDSVIPSSPSSESDQKQYLLRKQQKNQDRTYSRVADTKNQKGKNIHKSSFPVQNQGGRPVIHRRKSNQRKLSDLNRFPSPPPMNVASTDQDLDSGSQNLTKEQKQAEKKRLLQELEAAREARRAIERQREELVKKAKLMQNKTQNRRNHARDLWKKRYFEEKKRTPPLEEQCNKLRHELDVIHRKLMNALEGSSKDKNTRMENLKPSKQNNYKIQATRLTHEIDDLRRRLENAKMKLTAEMKLRNQAETELRALRAELTQKKIHLTLSRNQQMAMTPGGDSRYFRTPALSNKA